jgi:hypothetical protein
MRGGTCRRGLLVRWTMMWVGREFAADPLISLFQSPGIWNSVESKSWGDRVNRLADRGLMQSQYVVAGDRADNPAQVAAGVHEAEWG